MKKTEKEILKDFKAFIDFGIKEGKTLDYILANLNHDIVGLVSRDKCFLPRTTGYSKNEIKLTNWNEFSETLEKLAENRDEIIKRHANGLLKALKL